MPNPNHASIVKHERQIVSQNELECSHAFFLQILSSTGFLLTVLGFALIPQIQEREE
jgi:hypothetical protein